MATMHSAIAYAPDGFDSESRIRFLNLTFGQALAILPESVRNDYKVTYEWFIDNSGTVGKTLLGQHLEGTSEGFKTSAQRGIHVPANQDFALSIRVNRKSIYSNDQPRRPLPDGSWLLYYSAHRNNKGNETFAKWNDGLMNCMYCGLPVGVYIQEGPGSSDYYRALAFVEAYDPLTDTFTLHGPVMSLNENPGRALSPEHSSVPLFLPSPEELAEDLRKLVTVERKTREGQRQFRETLMRAYQGRCAMTGCSVDKTLQAAHIMDYRGYRTNVVNNGLMLRADIHLLFDNSLLSVDPEDMRIITGTQLKNTEYSELKGRKLRDTVLESERPFSDYLKVHFDKFLQLESA